MDRSTKQAGNPKYAPNAKLIRNQWEQKRMQGQIESRKNLIGLPERTFQKQMVAISYPRPRRVKCMQNAFQSRIK
ncbi:hypothetical protein RBWH47_00909 [Rhodopirellula baltica WH47]|uniref:Uncharacterized protein n=1 Tax=Rhodopirellula baltica WH47 TaxID=991778 RepID=F2AQF6_RHOBT|nr:hypothetical protein RBWH47_00909 [Rhodopirellula baltica WH47]